MQTGGSTTIRTAARAVPRVAPARADERWRESVGRRPLSAFAIAVAAVSLLLHAGFVTIALFGARVAAPPQEIAVEVVREMPTAPPPAPAPAKPETVAAAAKPAPAPVVAKPEPPPVVAKPVAAKPEPTPVAAKPPPPPPPAPDKADAERADLERQLAALEAEKQGMGKDEQKGGPLRDSIQAIALPSATDNGDGELVGYQSLVFSQLAKAKEGAKEAAHAATVGVHFDVDENGHLVDVGVAVSSGVASLDEESMGIVRKAAPFPKPPAGAERTFSANFAWNGPTP